MNLENEEGRISKYKKREGLLNQKKKNSNAGKSAAFSAMYLGMDSDNILCTVSSSLFSLSLLHCTILLFFSLKLQII